MSVTIESDLAKSGLVISDLDVRPLDASERAATGTPYSTQGYVIPYRNIVGDRVPFYRVKLFDGDIKYKQPREAANHVFFPKGFRALADASPFIIFTEGEKKAALSNKLGIPTIAFGGVESWRNRIFSIPADAEMTSGDKTIKARLAAGQEAVEDQMSPLALGLQDLVDYCIREGKKIIIIYDTDNAHGTSFNVQRAAASLGYELRFRGIPYANIRQCFLPWSSSGDKVGLDDYLQAVGTGPLLSLIELILSKRSAFPRHPNIRDYLNKRLQSSRISRREMQAIGLAVLSEMDANGIRLSSTEQLAAYYFDTSTHKLIKAEFDRAPQDLAGTTFGQFLYKTYGIGSADNRLIQWVGSQFTGEQPIEEVTPYRVFAKPPGLTYRDKVLFQIGDGNYVEISGEGEGVVIKDNGAEGVLFEAQQVVPINQKTFMAEYHRQKKEAEGRPIPFNWADTLLDVRLVDKDRARVVTALLFYMSPWLLRWRGTQLPMEMTLGEAGSGKSTLQSLRMTIINGFAKLRNAPQDMKDWAASVTSTGGMHLTDNLQLADKNMRQRMSDEICRIVTEADPKIEMRKYYTNADLLDLPVRCTFGITAIKQPFLNADVLQRGILIELDKSQDVVNGTLSYDSNWEATQISRFGGREAWLAHHCLVLHRFFQEVAKSWNMKYPAKHRLINFEQGMLTMAKVFGVPADWIPNYLAGVANKAITEADWAFEGIITFANEKRMQNYTKGFTVQEISNWAISNEDYEKCEEIINNRRLGRYMQSHKGMIATVAGIVEDGKANNRQRYRVVLN